jgi:hypothetical protein
MNAVATKSRPANRSHTTGAKPSKPAAKDSTSRWRVFELCYERPGFGVEHYGYLIADGPTPDRPIAIVERLMSNQRAKDAFGVCMGIIADPSLLDVERDPQENPKVIVRDLRRCGQGKEEYDAYLFGAYAVLLDEFGDQMEDDEEHAITSEFSPFDQKRFVRILETLLRDRGFTDTDLYDCSVMISVVDPCNHARTHEVAMRRGTIKKRADHPWVDGKE